MKELKLLKLKWKVGKIYFQTLKKWLVELSERKNKLLSQLNERDQHPKAQAEKKGQITEGLKNFTK